MASALVARFAARWEMHAFALSVALTVMATAWFTLALVHPVGPRAVGLLPGVVATMLAAGSFWSAAASTAQRPATARFWRHVGLATCLVGIATALRTVDSLDPDTDIRQVEPLAMTVYMGAISVVGWALLRLPLGLTGARNRWRFLLDSGTVMLSAGLFFWYLTVRAMLESGRNAAGMAAPLSLAFTVVLLFALVKAAMTAAATVNVGALRALGLALAVGSLGSAPEYLLPASGPTTGFIVVPLASTFGLVAGVCQRRACGPSAVAERRRQRRSFSVLPYSAVAASSALLLYSATTDHRSDRLVVAGVVVCLVVLVVVRQILGMSDLSASERRFRSLVQNSSDLITVTGPDGCLAYISPGAHRMLGIEPAEWIGRSGAGLVHPDDMPTVYRHYADIKDEPGATAVYEARFAHRDGQWRRVEVSILNLLDDAAVGGIVGNARDITEERAFQQRLHHQAHHDSLTQLANRELFHERIGEALAAGPPERLCVLLIDLNEFKAVNDTLGHAAGDALLMVVAERMCARVRPGDTVARLGGDEFAVLADMTGRDLTALLTGVMDAFVDPIRTVGVDSRVGASIGVASGQPGATAEELLRRADVAMYAAKADRDGAGTRYAVYTEALDSPIIERAAVEEELRAAIESGQLRLLYQPIVSVDGNRVAAVEALVRWAHPERGLLPPAQFVPLAERSDLIVGMGRWALLEACGQANRWHAAYGDGAPVISVNVSARQLHDRDFVDHLRATLVDTGLPPHRLTLEITETTAVHPQSVEVLRELHRLGVRLSLDDFGTGHSPLSLLESCPVDEVKLDHSFVRTVLTAGDRSVAVALIQLARALHIDVVAEGVETADEASHLAQLGYRHLQGFQFARPGGPDQIDQMIRSFVPAQPRLASLALPA